MELPQEYRWDLPGVPATNPGAELFYSPTADQPPYFNKPKKYEISKMALTLPIVAFLGTFMTGSLLAVGYGAGDEQSTETAKYTAMATAATLGVSILATLGASVGAACKMGGKEGCRVWKRSICSFRESEGMIVNTVSAIFPPAWCCWIWKSKE